MTIKTQTTSFGPYASVAGTATLAFTHALANAAGATAGVKAFPCAAADAGPAQAAKPQTSMPHTSMIPSRPWHAAPPRDLTRL